MLRMKGLFTVPEDRILNDWKARKFTASRTVVTGNVFCLGGGK